VKGRGSVGAAETSILLALAKDGCPICHLDARIDDSFFFWFFNENYSEPHTILALTRSLGFCLLHSERLTRSGTGASQLTTVYEWLARRIRATLSSGAGGAQSAKSPRAPVRREGRCPACQDRENQEARNALWLAGILEDPSLASAYGRPGLLCAPHMQLVLPHLSRAPFERLLATHDVALGSALGSLSDLAAELESTPADARQDRKKALLPALQVIVGHERDTGAYPRLDESDADSRERDPVGELLRSCGEQACPVCREVRRAWIEWIRWLDEPVARPGRVADLLPGCPEHVWAVVHRAGECLAGRAATRALERGLGDLRIAAGTLHPPPPKPDRRPRLLERIEDALWGPSRRFQRAREMLLRADRCPICERLTLAQDRAIRLLFALLQDSQHRIVVERGYGLCLSHFARALALDPPPEIAAALAGIEAARLACLHWELEEASRKSAWRFRPEQGGAERTAWRRALLRFSGSLAGTWS